MLLIRSLLFYCCLMLLSIIFGTLALVFLPFPYRVRHGVVINFNHWAIVCLRLCCGIRYEISGAEHLPAGPFVIMSKHQCTWETFFLQAYFAPLSTILKRELLRIPFFGWGLAAMRPIPIDRSNPRQAIKQVKHLGAKRLAEGNNILVFPEGTRTPLGETGTYARSGADIAIASGVPVVAVAHNAGLHWPMDTFIKYPGVIKVNFSEPIETDAGNSKAITQKIKTWIEAETNQMPTCR